MMKYLFTYALLLPFALSNAWAGNDKFIQGNLRSNIQDSMSQYITTNTINGKLLMYDSVGGKLLKMKLDNLHSGIVKKGDFYVSCADFVDQNNRKIDIDFMVIRNKENLITTQALVHSINGKKRKYHLEQM